MSLKIVGLIGRSVVLTAGCVLIGVLYNAVRPNGIDLVAPAPYQIYVPCPESLAEVETTTAADVQSKTKVLYVDARPAEDFEKAHIKGAVSFPYPLLGDPEPDRVEALKRKGLPIVTYCDGGRSKFGEMMAKLLTELGVENVTHLEGGLEAWQKQGGALVETDEASDE
jgi:rhodanese-related sulfurtransferase